MIQDASPAVQMLRRGAPRAIVILGGLGIAATSHSLVFWLGFVIALAALPTNWPHWWRYVRTGDRPTDQLAAEFTEEGTFGVELLDSGDRPIEVIKALREVAVPDLATAKRLATSAPSLIAENLSSDSAQRVSARVDRAGGLTAISQAR